MLFVLFCLSVLVKKKSRLVIQYSTGSLVAKVNFKLFLMSSFLLFVVFVL